ncbi:microfibrillar-associated protein 2 [Electrophorus electricus]|uniref:Microfibril associated protein 5 n=1 Tax=Electrophorus electricus TaxID=8005 RepID=A0A4W4FQG4_ELEEL|nr:microfibrillar-associated protein 2 [Electrophorus electricus]
MGSHPTVMLLCCFCGLAAVWAQQTELPFSENSEGPQDCREETYPCTRMYSVHRPIKRCIHSLCLYSLPRVYMINKEICVRTVCQQEEALKAEICREKSGWPKRVQRSIRRRCYR